MAESCRVKADTTGNAAGLGQVPLQMFWSLLPVQKPYGQDTGMAAPLVCTQHPQITTHVGGVGFFTSMNKSAPFCTHMAMVGIGQATEIKHHSFCIQMLRALASGFASYPQ